jgi:ubiquinone/menaquinone biosynthesis C-methylase UbiE
MPALGRARELASEGQLVTAVWWQGLPMPSLQRRRLVSLISRATPERARILVLRCRTGRTSRAVARACPDAEVIGVDSDPERIQRARTLAERSHLPRVSYVVAELDSLPWEDKRFDISVVMLGLHELADAERGKVLSEGRRVLQDGGKFFALEPDRPERRVLGGLADFWFRHFEEPWVASMLGGGLIRELESGGFELARKEVMGSGFLQLVQANKPR